MMTKKEFRKQALFRRSLLTESEREHADSLLVDRILTHRLYKECDVFLAFVSYGTEISTRKIIESALNDGKEVYVPLVTGDGEMQYYRIFSLSELKEGYCSIPEPEGNTDCYIYSGKSAKRTFVLFPGAAFDRENHRIGYGKGFYDRYFSDKQPLLKYAVAVGYSCQMYDEIPFDNNDLKPAEVICV